jgi:hypothetical protein
VLKKSFRHVLDTLSDKKISQFAAPIAEFVLLILRRANFTKEVG